MSKTLYLVPGDLAKPLGDAPPGWEDVKVLRLCANEAERERLIERDAAAELAELEQAEGRPQLPETVKRDIPTTVLLAAGRGDLAEAMRILAAYRQRHP